MAKDNVRLANVINNSAADAPDPEKAAKLRALSRRALTTQKKGHAYDKEMEVIHQSWTALARPKVPRGVARLFASRTHHCGTCHKAYDVDCERKGHMEQCPNHEDARSMPGKECINCVAVEAANARRAEKQRKAEAKLNGAKNTALNRFLAEGEVKDRKPRHKTKTEGVLDFMSRLQL